MTYNYILTRSPNIKILTLFTVQKILKNGERVSNLSTNVKKFSYFVELFSSMKNIIFSINSISRREIQDIWNWIYL